MIVPWLYGDCDMIVPRLFSGCVLLPRAGSDPRDLSVVPLIFTTINAPRVVQLVLSLIIGALMTHWPSHGSRSRAHYPQDVNLASHFERQLVMMKLSIDFYLLTQTRYLC